MPVAATLARQRLIALLAGITPAAGYGVDLTDRVLAGDAQRLLDDATPRPCIAVHSLGDIEQSAVQGGHACSRRLMLECLLDATGDWEAAQDQLLVDVRRALAQTGVRAAERLDVVRDGEAVMQRPEPGSARCLLLIPLRLGYVERWAAP